MQRISTLRLRASTRSALLSREAKAIEDAKEEEAKAVQKEAEKEETATEEKTEE